MSPKTIRFIESNQEWGADVVYGDTDSLFVRLKGKTQKEAFEAGAAIADAVTKSNPRPIKLKLEKVGVQQRWRLTPLTTPKMYLPSVLLAKKRYTGNMFERSTDTEGVFEAKGIETVRRDGIPAQAKMVETALKWVTSVSGRFLSDCRPGFCTKRQICRRSKTIACGNSTRLFKVEYQYRTSHSRRR